MIEPAHISGYWGKAQQQPSDSGADYHLLAYHSLDVAAVAWTYLEKKPQFLSDLCDFLEIDRHLLQQTLAFVASLHDLGKFASAFQNLFTHHSECLVKEDVWLYDGKDYRHDRLGLYFWQKIQKDALLLNGIASDASALDDGDVEACLKILMNCALGHHGQPVRVGPIRRMKNFIAPSNVAASQAFFLAMVELFKPELPAHLMQSAEWRKRLELVSWQLAGMFVLSDWVGSDVSHFPYQTKPMPLESYWPIALKQAELALQATDLAKPVPVQPYRSIQEQFKFEPTPLQQWAEQVEVGTSPQLFILEDITGSGKTEAALALTHRLLQAGAAEGFYFGLPTMATSNAMFYRVSDQYLNMLGGHGYTPSIVLAHGASAMNEAFQEAKLNADNPDSSYNSDDQTATAQCNQWLSDSRKKALLAPVGVGTIDQALLAVLPRRHQSLRLLGMSRKVLIFDEVHAADDYMFELLESLLALHLHQGGSAILLTATLSKKQRQRLIHVWQSAAGLPKDTIQNTHFPLATKVSIHPHSSLQETALESRADVCRSVAVNFIHNTDACIQKVMQTIAKGDCVVWVRNSVDDACEAYQALTAIMDHPENCLLFHSRFILQDRKRIETQVLQWFGKFRDKHKRRGKVLIATQVFQESLDADADLLISDICPIDDLIQRAGRLHRHTRNEQRVYQPGIVDTRQPPELWLHCPPWDANPSVSWLSESFRNTQYVYRSPGRLWLAYRKLKELGAITMPEKARELIEAVYREDAYDDIPQTLIKLEHELIADEIRKAHKGKSVVLNWQRYGYSDRSAKEWTEDDIDISTRFSDIETVEVLLLKMHEHNGVEPWVGQQKYAIQLSTLKVAKHKYADRLAAVPNHLEAVVERFKTENRAAKYLQIWLPQCDTYFEYHPDQGFVLTQKQEV